MTVRAKFQCQGVTPLDAKAYGEGTATVTLRPVYGDGTDNASWSKATPAGQLDMTITNPAAVAAFVVGKSYFLDFTPAD